MLVSDKGASYKTPTPILLAHTYSRQTIPRSLFLHGLAFTRLPQISIANFQTPSHSIYSRPTKYPPVAQMAGVFSVVGLITVSIFLFKITNLVALYLRPSRLDRYAHESAMGEKPWALVTGSSGGIGLALAYELAASGFNVVLHGRSRERLLPLTSQLQEAFPERSFRVLVNDAEAVSCVTYLNATSQQQKQLGDSTSTPVDFAAIKRELEDIHLTVLVNNAGGGPINPTYLPLAESSEARITANASLNALFPMHLARALLPSLIQHTPSLVINISSMADRGLPLLTSYCASKAFLMTATRSLRREMEMEGNGVEVLGVRIGKVTGARGHTDPVSLFVPNAETAAKAILARAGRANGIVVGYWGHAIQQALATALSLLPNWVEDKVAISVIRRERSQLGEETKAKIT